MSIIIYGPQGCGKSLKAEQLRKFFKMDEVVDDGSDPYPITMDQVAEFKAGKVLFLTHIDPKHKDYSNHSEGGERRVISFDRAMKMMNGEI